MPIIKSSIKDTRRIKRRTVRNQAVKSAVKTAVKSVYTAANKEEAKARLRLAMKVLDTACSNGILKRNTASRKIARLSALVHKKFGA